MVQADDLLQAAIYGMIGHGTAGPEQQPPSNQQSSDLILGIGGLDQAHASTLERCCGELERCLIQVCQAQQNG